MMGFSYGTNEPVSHGYKCRLSADFLPSRKGCCNKRKMSVSTEPQRWDAEPRAWLLTCRTCHQEVRQLCAFSWHLSHASLPIRTPLKLFYIFLSFAAPNLNLSSPSDIMEFYPKVLPSVSVGILAWETTRLCTVHFVMLGC